MIFDHYHQLIRFEMLKPMLHVYNVKCIINLFFFHIEVEANLAGFRTNGFTGGRLLSLSMSDGDFVQLSDFAKLCVNLTLLLKATESCE